MARTYTVAGTSNFKGQITYRFASGKAKAREAVLVRNEHTDVNMIDLPMAMTKEDAIAHLNGIGITAVLPKTGRTPKVKTVEDAARELLDAVNDSVTESADEPANTGDVVAEDVAFLTSMSTT
jgi:hypothetical protein